MAFLAACHGAAASAGPLLPAQSPDRHLGVASCSSSVCHGAVQPPNRPGPSMNEFVTWSHQDSHAKAFQALLSPAARSMAAKLGLASPERAKECLDCHADNVPDAQRAKTFALSDGVGCEACHGGAERWIASHTGAHSSYRSDVQSGMYPTADLNDRAALCLSCHVGTTEKLATHRIMAAGHPRLSFELDTFGALEPAHYRVNDDYRRRKPTYPRTEVWSRGQVLASQAQLRLLRHAMSGPATLFPELALFNCTSCHDSSMHRLEWRPRELLLGSPAGTVPVNDASLRMSWVIASTSSPEAGARLRALSQALQSAALGDRHQVSAAAGQLQAELARLSAPAPETGSVPTPRALLKNVIRAGIDGEYRDYLGAEQALMAIDVLLLESQATARYKAQVDELYRLLHSDETYRPAEFIAALESLDSAIN